MEKKQSSLDYLIEQLEGENNRIAMVVGVKKYNSIVKEAKAMHKDEIEDAWINGLKEQMIAPFAMNTYKPEAQEYYTKTFGGNDE